MKTRHAAALSLCAALALPFAANASGVWHQTDTEIGYAIAPEHAAGGKSRAQVDSELAAAKADPQVVPGLSQPGHAGLVQARHRAHPRRGTGRGAQHERARARPPEQHLHPG